MSSQLTAERLACVLAAGTGGRKPGMEAGSAGGSAGEATAACGDFSDWGWVAGWRVAADFCRSCGGNSDL